MITFQVETWDSWYANAQPLFNQHWEELALDREKFRCELFVERYVEAEKVGVLFIASVRDDGRMVGYYVAGLLPHLHYKSGGTMAHTDMYFILPEYRKGNGTKLLMFVEEEFRKRGVSKVYLSCKAHLDHTELFEALGFRLSDKMFTKCLI